MKSGCRSGAWLLILICAVLCLFSCGQKSAFPVDTWVEKLLTQWYGMSGTRSGLKKQARAHFGSYGGLAQQMLFASAMQQRLRRTEEKNT